MLITTANLKTQTKNDLARMAKRLGLVGWNSLSKDQLVAAIIKRKTASKKAAKPPESRKAATKGAASKPASSKQSRVTVASKPSTKGTNAKSSNKSKAVSSNGKVPHSSSSNGSTHSASNSANKSKGVNKNSPLKPSVGKADIKQTSTSKAKPTGKPAGAQSAVSKPIVAKPVAAKPSAAKPEAKKLEAKKPEVKKPDAKKPEAKKLELKKPVEKKPTKPAEPPTNPEVLQRIRELQVQRDSNKDLSNGMVDAKKDEDPKKVDAVEGQKDRIALVVRDAFWLQVSWDITRRAVERARAAMAEHWHHAQPILRLLRLDDSGTTSSAETIERDIFIHGGVRNWYLDLNGTPGRFRVMIGYLSGSRFHMLSKSNIVRTPTPGTTDADDHWSDIAKDAERIFALSGGYDSEQETTELQEVFEDRLKRSMGGPQLAQYGSGAETAYRGRGGFHFDMEVELYIYGSTVPDGFVTLNGEPVKLRSDGTFTLRLPFPDRRQVLPAVACSRDGVQQRTVVVAVERNTKVMEPFSKEQDDQP